MIVGDPLPWHSRYSLKPPTSIKPGPGGKVGVCTFSLAELVAMAIWIVLKVGVIEGTTVAVAATGRGVSMGTTGVWVGDSDEGWSEMVGGTQAANSRPQTKPNVIDLVRRFIEIPLFESKVTDLIHWLKFFKLVNDHCFHITTLIDETQVLYDHMTTFLHRIGCSRTLQNAAALWQSPPPE